MKTTFLILFSAISLTGTGQYFSSVSTGSIASDGGLTRAAAWIDYDNDGDLDIYLCNNNNEDNFLYRNDGGAFTRITNGPHVNDGANSYASQWADYDNDGDLDVFLVNDGVNALYENNGSGSFTQILVGDIVTDNEASRAATWWDYDNDGLLDLFVANVSNQNNSLYHNDGGGSFTKINTGSIVNDGGASDCATIVDYDGDGDMDLIVCNAFGQDNFFYENNGNGTFTSITNGDVVNDGGDSYSALWGDIDNDGNEDLFVTNYSNEVNFLYISDGNGGFTKVSGVSMVTTQNYTSGSEWSDIDNDGDLDLLVGNTSFNQNETQNEIYINDGTGNFTMITSGEDFVDDIQATTNLSASDYNNDGYPDLMTCGNQYGLSNFIYDNSGGSNSWIKFRLEGITSNRSAIGSIVRVKANINGTDVWQMRTLRTSSNNKGQMSLRLEFGLDDATEADSVVVEWPSGMVCTFTNVGVNTMYDIDENCMINATVGINEIKESRELNIYPNPVDQAATIEFNSAIGGQLSLRNIEGRLIESFSIQEGTRSYVLNTAGLSSGTYVLIFEHKNGLEVRKLIKN